jgi:hypothetical protein
VFFLFAIVSVIVDLMISAFDLLLMRSRPTPPVMTMHLRFGVSGTASGLFHPFFAGDALVPSHVVFVERFPSFVALMIVVHWSKTLYHTYFNS